MAEVDRAELTRRIVLGLVTALIVARPLLSGEDPGRTHPATGNAGQDIAFLWLLAAAGWSAWRAWSQQTWQVSWVEIGLAAFVVLVFVSAGFAARYKHAAWLISWEWLAVLAAFVLIRQLPQSEQENRGLLTAILASAVSLAVFGVYQALQPARSASPVDSLLAQIFGLDLPRRAEGSALTATFASSNSFAAFLLLAAPALAIGWHRVQNAGRPRWQVVLTGLCFALVFLCLGMSRSWSAVIALALVGMIFLLPRHSAEMLGVRAALLVGVLVLGGLVALATFNSDFQEWLSARTEFAAAAWKMSGDHFWLGVGPGNFSKHFPAYVALPTSERVAPPDSFFLETLATTGFLSVVALLIALVAFARRMWPEIRCGWPQTEETPTENDAAEAPVPQRTSWEFYLGGIIGLTIAFLLGPAGWSKEEMLRLGGVAAVRSLVWFAAFALLEMIPWTERWRLTALAAGVLASFFCLLTSGGFFSPSLAQPLCVMAALALNATPAGRPLTIGGRLGLILPVPILVVLCWVHLLVVLLPLGGAGRSHYRARLAYPAWAQTVEPQWSKIVNSAERPADKLKAANRAETFLNRLIIKPLEEAVKSDPADANLHIELAYWQGQGRELFAPIRDLLEPDDRERVEKRRAKYSVQAIDVHVKKARELDPIGKGSYWVGSKLWGRAAEEPGLTQGYQAKYYLLAAEQLRPLVKRDPADVRVRYLLIEALVKTGDSELVAEGAKQAEQTLELAARADPAAKPLSKEERQNLQEWSKFKESD